MSTMKRIIIYTGILTLVGLSHYSLAQTKYKFQVKKTNGTPNCPAQCGSNTGTGITAISGTNRRANINAIYTDANKPSKVLITSAGEEYDDENDLTYCVSTELESSIGLCSELTLNSSAASGTGSGTSSVSSCTNDIYKVLMFSTPGQVTITPNAQGRFDYCPNEVISLSTSACTSIDNPSFTWEVQKGAGSWQFVKTSTTTTTTVSLSQIFSVAELPAGYGVNFRFRVRYTNHSDLDYSLPSLSASFNNPSPSISGVSRTNATCNGVNNGTFTIQGVAGSVTTYRCELQQWNGSSWIAGVRGASTSSFPYTFTGLPPGTYRVRVSNETAGGGAASCTPAVSSSLTIASPPQLVLDPVSCTNCQATSGTTFTTTCNGGAANVQFTIKGGNGGYRYRTYKAGTTPPAYTASSATVSVNLTAGTYLVEVTDANFCSPSPTQRAITIRDPAIITSTIVPKNKAHGFQVSCFGAADGQIDVLPAGGHGPFNVRLYKSSTLIDQQNNVSKGSLATLSGLVAGASDYSVQISEANYAGCSQSFAVAPLTTPAAITATIQKLTKANGSHLSCATSAVGFTPDGQLQVTPQGGTGPFTVHVKSGGTTLVSRLNVVQGTAVTLSGLSAGVAYTVEVIDEVWCGSYSTTLSPLNAPTPPVIAVNKILKTNGTSVSCRGGNDGIIEVTPTNGSNITAFDVELLTVDTRTNIASGNKVTFNGLSARSYTLRITEKVTSACVFEQTITLDEPPAVIAFIERGAIQTNGVAHISCNGGNDGSLTVRPQSGGNGAPYSVTVARVSGGYNNTEINMVANATKTFTGLPAGTYTVTIRDKDDCSTSFTKESTGASADLILSEPAPITVGSFSTRNVTCLGDTDGTVNVTINGGNLYNPTGIRLFDLNNATATFPAPTQVAANEFRWTNLAPGNYRVTITDSKSCVLQDTDPWANSSFSITKPTQALGLQVAGNTPVTCNGLSDGIVVVQGVGGWGSYVYSSDGTNFSATPSANFTFNGLAEGNHQFWVRDALGCVTSTNVTVIEPPVLVPRVVATTHVSCNGGNNGSITLGATGGWGAGSYTFSTQPTSGFTSNATFNTLSEGNYTFYVRTNGNCPAPISFTITEPPILTANIETTKIRPITCHGANDGAVTLNIAGGTTPYKVAANGGAFVAGNFIEGLIPGNNSLRVEDAKGCFVLLNVTIHEPNALQVSLVQKKETACLEAKGLAQVTGVGGTAPYSYQWLDVDNNVLGTGATLSNLNAGSYRVIVTDANSCMTSLPIGISTLGAPQIQLSGTTPASCEAAADGTATIQITSGIAPVSLRWDNGQTTLTATGLTPGLHLVTLTDGDGCKTVEEVTVPLGPQMVIQTTTQTNPGCFNACDGRLAVQTTGGVAPYTYTWNIPGKTGPSLNNLCAGYYAVIVTDAKGCTQTQTFQLIAPSPLSLQVKENKAPACFGGCDGRIVVAPNGGTAPYTYAWGHDAAQATATVDGLCTGVYTVTITDAKGCQLTQSIRLSEPSELVIGLSQKTDPLCHNADAGKLEVTVSGGVAPYTYQWSAPGQANIGNSAVLEGVAAGAYTLTVTDANACVKSANYVLSNPAALSLQLVQSASKDPDCNKGCDGILRVQGQGGTAPYTYRWNNGQTSNEATGLCAGSHSVTITDANGCALSASYELFDPAPIALNLPTTVTLCPGQVYTANAGNAGASYEWTYQGGFLSSSRVVDLSQEGSYTLKVTNFKGCVTTTTLELISSSDALKADLTMLDRGVVGDTVAAINLSFPVPERVDWKVSGTEAQRTLLNYPATFEQAIIFKETGTYTVTLFIYSGNCQDSISQTIEIFATEQEAEGGRKTLGYQPEVKVEQSKVYPNPTFGNFKVHVKLSKAGDATVKIRSAQTSGMITQQTKTGDKDYTFDFALQKLPYGVYFVVIETEDDTKTLKVLIH